MISFYCRFCGQKMGVKPTVSGMSINCPRCNHELVAPNADGTITPKAPGSTTAEKSNEKPKVQEVITIRKTSIPTELIASFCWILATLAMLLIVYSIFYGENYWQIMLWTTSCGFLMVYFMATALIVRR